MTPTATTPTPPEIFWPSPERAQAFTHWLTALLPQYPLQPHTLRPASADASFRRYLRIDSALSESPGAGGSLIIMDAPPQHENSRPFVHVARLMQDAGLRVPEILNWDEVNGFMLITDLGTQTVLEALNSSVPAGVAGNASNLPVWVVPPPDGWQPDMALAKDLLTQATQILIRWQLASKPGVLPAFDQALLNRELNLFPEWYIGQHRQAALTSAQQTVLNSSFELITKRCLTSSNVYMHRDYMPRNLMLGAPRPEGSTTGLSELGVLDFQDATYGPISYDIASLMRDAFHSWDEEFVLDITIRYWEAARKAGLPVDADFSDFWLTVEWMGLQRHLKILGIFARLTLRDGKPKYLADTPRFIHYVRTTCDRYRALGPLLKLIDQIENIEPQYAYSYGRS